MTVTTEREVSIPALFLIAGDHVWSESTQDWERVLDVFYRPGDEGPDAGSKVTAVIGERDFLIFSGLHFVRVTR